ncbi:hypothetical protein M0Q28_04240 [Patescibacteria group bacterium]|jgi:hypothetical protein|nr:hypothetical protein [Patescibacteria group bacterium]
MANQKTLEQIASRLRNSPLVRRSLEYQLPISTMDTALSHLHQVRRLNIYPTVQDTDITFVIELHSLELDASSDEIHGLDPLFAGYANSSEMTYKDHGRVKFFQKNGDAWWPERYVLRPTFGPKDVASAEAADRRLKLLEEKLDRKPRQIILSWSLMNRALETWDRVDDKGDHPWRASFYQAAKDPDGEDVLWTAVLPQLSNQQRPDKQGRLKLAPNQGGLLVQLTAPFLANLLFLLRNAGAAEDGLNFAEAYYLSPPTHTRESLKERIRQLENELATTRELLAGCGGDDEPTED